ncbi:hypothetical protein Tco_0487223 [Tanacetum coccineum]
MGCIQYLIGGNVKSKKMLKYILNSTQFEGFSRINTEGLHRPMTGSKVLLIQLEIHGASLSFDDLYNNLRVFESDVKGSTASFSSPQNVAFVSKNTSNTNDVSTAYCVPNPSGQTIMSVESREIKITRGGMHGILEQRMGAETGKKEDSKALVTIDREGVDWTNHSEEDEDYALMACNSSESDTEVTSCLNKCKESYANLKKLYDAQREQLSDASIEIKAYTQGLKKVEA